MSDLTKGDQAALKLFYDNLTGDNWEAISEGNWEQVWQAACAYKQKRITELEAVCEIALSALYYDPDFVDGGQVTKKATDSIEAVLSEGGGDD